MDILCKKIFYIRIFSFFSGFKYYFLSDVSILPISQLQTQQVMTSQIRSRVEYLMQTYYIFMLIL